MRPAASAAITPSDIQNKKSSLISENHHAIWFRESEGETNMLDAKIIERAFERTGKSKGGLAKILDVRPGAISEILSGIRLIKASEVAPIMEYLGLNAVPVLGRVGAGAVIEPDNEQVPPACLCALELSR